jgi:predicted signal transduction protein with EAL and GGDEF domain
LGGDEFTIILPSAGSEQDVAGVAQKILESLAQPFHIDQNEAYVSGSIGIAIFPHDADSAEDLLKGADSAMYRAKSKGKNNYQFYTADMNLKAAAHFTMEVDLRRAIERNELLLARLCYVGGAGGMVWFRQVNFYR